MQQILLHLTWQFQAVQEPCFWAKDGKDDSRDYRMCFEWLDDLQASAGYLQLAGLNHAQQA